MNTDDIKTGRPVLVINRSRLGNNLDKMISKAAASQTLLRPHVKTIHLPEVAETLKLKGIDAITVSNAEMALEFASAGWNDILLAFPPNPHNKELYQKLIGMLPEGNMHFIVESAEMAVWLNNIHPVKKSVWIKLDAGQGRTGIPAGDLRTIRKLRAAIEELPGLQFRGLLAHFGQLYGILDHAAKMAEIARATQLIQQAGEAIADYGHYLLSAGDTPSASLMKDFSPFDEFRAGNFLYYDLMQWQAGHCLLNDIAVSVICPVVSHHPSRKQSVIHGGAIHFAKDFIDYPQGQSCYGLVIEERGINSQPKIAGILVSLSQEHGIITWTDPDRSLQAGDTVRIIPVHSCHTAYQLRNSWMFES